MEDEADGFQVVDAMEGDAKKRKIKPGSFQGLGLSQATFKAIMRIGYKQPTPIQRKTIPTIMEGQDMVAMARTGSGKTAAFLVPINERLKEHSVAVGVRAIVLSPTRELAMQTGKFMRKLSRFNGLRTCLLVGGQAMETQFTHLANNPDVLIATPGRLMHHMLEADLSLSRVEMLVFDEADRLFELGFAEQLNKIMEATPVSRQVCLFSATLPSQLVSFSRSGIKDPVFIRLDVETTLSELLELQFLYVRKGEKLAAAVSVCRRLAKDDKSTIMFVATRHHVEFFGELFKQIGISCSMVHGSMDQAARESQVERFRRRKTSFLVTTDVAARGIDIPLLDHVLNFDFPPSAKLFVHRSGRTARAGRSGLSVSLVTNEDLPYTVELMLFLGHKLEGVGTRKEAMSADGKRPLLGAVPALEYEVETLEMLLGEEGTNLKSLHKSMMCSYSVYNKTRPAASKQSVKRARELLDECGGPARLQGMIHPAFRDDAGLEQCRGIGSAGADDKGMDFIQTLRCFRPKREKIGNVISTEGMKTMEQAKKEAVISTSTRNEFMDADFDDPNPDEGRKSARRKRQRESTPAVKAVPKGPRMSKRARKAQKGGASAADDLDDDFDDFDVKVDGVELGSKEGKKKEAGKKKPAVEQFYLSTERDHREEAKERGLDMEQYAMDLMPDEDGVMKGHKSVIRWDTKKKKFLPVMIGADGKIAKNYKKKDESGRPVNGDAEKTKAYEKWAKTSKLRVQRPGEMEQGGVDTRGKNKIAADNARIARTIDFDAEGNTVYSKGHFADQKDPAGRKPLVPFHGEVEEKYLTNKQKRIMARRQKTDRVVTDKGAKSEVRTAAQIQKEKKQKEQRKLKQNPHMRKAKAKQAKDKRMQMHEERQMKFGAKTRSKMLVFEGEKKWNKGKARPQNGHQKKSF